jgi:hypothetical protein
MQHCDKSNYGYKYVLTVIDVFSKYAWVRPIRSKSGSDVASAFKDIMDGSKRSPRLGWSEKGKEFYNKNFESLVTLYSTENEEKSCVVERFNRTLQGIMFKYFTPNNTYKYIDVLQEMVDLYNNTKHVSIKMTPAEANEPQVNLNLYDDVVHDTQEWPKPKCSVGDRVRITKKHTVLEKSYSPLWTEELFVVLEVQYTSPITYKLKDLNGEAITGTFYEQEMQKSNQDTFRIEKILKTKGEQDICEVDGLF